MDNLTIALEYLRKGLTVIPLWSPAQFNAGCPRWWNDKVLRIQEKPDLTEEEKELEIMKEFERLCKTPIVIWREFQSRLPTEDEVKQWFGADFPAANIGIVTGQFANVVVFDIDSPGAEQYAKEHGGFPRTAISTTGKGRHIYVRPCGFEIRNRVNKALAIDIRGDGGYAVAPPSVHGNGSVYTWEEGSSILEVDPAECNQWMQDYLRRYVSPVVPEGIRSLAPGNTKVNRAAGVKETRVETAKRSSDHPEPSVVSILRDGVDDGERNHQATRVIGSLLGRGVKPDLAWELICSWNKQNRPPIDEGELKNTFVSVQFMESQKQIPRIDVSHYLDTLEDILEKHEESYIRVPFARDHFRVLEDAMNGGLKGGCFYLLGGIPSAGKTLLLNQIADNICLNDHPVLFFSLDDGRSDLQHRTFARFSQHSIEDLNTNRVGAEDLKGICSIPEIRKIQSRKYVVSQGINMEQWDELVQQIDGDHNRKPVIVIDYLRKLRSKKRSADERLRVDNLILHLTELAKRHNLPILAISELARDSYKGGQRLSIGSFKESGTIEYEASWLGILAPVKESDGRFRIEENWERLIKQDGSVDLVILKAKRGTGRRCRLPLRLDITNMTISDRPVITDPPKTKKPSHFG